MKLVDQILEFFKIDEMGRTRNEMIDLVRSLEPTISEHIWKIWAYHWDRPNDVNSWLKSLNKHLRILRSYNVQKGDNRRNLDREYLIDKLVIEPFEHIGDIEVLIGNWSDEGYPVVHVTEDRIKDIQDFASKYVDLILSKSGKIGIESSKLL